MGFTANDRALGKLDGMPRRFRGGLDSALHRAGALLVRTSQQGQAHGSKSGRLYGSHQASAPGEYSAPRTWSLHNSTAYEVSGAHTMRFGLGTHYGAYQEFGTSKMGARRNLQQSYETNEAQLQQVFGVQLLRMIVDGG